MKPRPISQHRMTAKQRALALQWCQDRLGLEGWQITIIWGSTVPEWVTTDDSDDYGVCDSNHAARTAKIWINVQRHITDDMDCLITFFHEITHIAHQCSLQDPDREATVREEFLIDRIGAAFADAYRAGI